MDVESQLRNYFGNLEDNKNEVRKIYNVSDKDIERDVKILKEWIKKEPHLPQKLEDIFFEKMLLFNKFRVERTKSHIDAFFTVKTLDPEMYSGLENTQLINQATVVLCMPTLLPNKGVLIIWRLNILDPNRYNIIDCLQNWIIFYECAIKYFYIPSVHIVIDFAGLTVAHLKRVNLNHAIKMIKLLSLPFTMRIESFDVINIFPAAVPLINVCKSFMKNKLASKVHVYSKLSDVQIDLKYLPKDIGGTAESQEEMIKKMQRLIDLNYEHLKSLKDIRSDESKRIGEPIFGLQDFGPQGTFKQINVD